MTTMNNFKLHQITHLPTLLKEWDRIDQNGTFLPAIRALCLVDRYYLLVKVLGRQDMLHQWLFERCREVEANPDEYLDLWAREHYKSTIITFAGAIQEMLRDPEITIGIFSHTKDIAKDFLRQIKDEFERNQYLARLFPNILYKKGENPPAGSWNLDSISVKRTSNPKEATLEAHGLVEGMPTGKHFQLMIYDDVVVPASVSTPEQITKTNAAWSLSDNLGARTNGLDCRKWHIGTRYSYVDTYDYIINKGVITPRIYPATTDGTPSGDPVLLTVEQWDRKKKTQSESDIACQMLQNPLAGQQRMFDIEAIRTYEIRPNTLNVYILVDPARTININSDNTAIAVIGVDALMNKYLLDGANQKCDLQQRWHLTSTLYKRWVNAEGVQTVKVGYEAFGAYADLDYFREQMKKPSNPHFTISELTWTKGGRGESSKSARVQRLGPDIKTGKLFLPYPTNPARLTKHQLEMIEQGMEYRVAKKLIKKDYNNQIYDLSEQLKSQIAYFPVGKKDLVDAVSRIYDMDPQPASIVEDGWILDPDFT